MSEARPVLRPVDFDPFAPVSVRMAPLVLTEPQAEMWTAAAMGRDANCSYNQCFAFTLDGPLRIESLRAALDQVVARHDGLRAVIAPDGSGQSVRVPFSVEVPLIDLSRPRSAGEAASVSTACSIGNARRPSTSPRARWCARSSSGTPRSSTASCSPRITSCATGGRRRCSSPIWAGCTPPIASASPPSSARRRPTRDYVAEQTSRDHVAAAAADEDFWAAQYDSGAPVLDLPLDRPRPATKTYRSGRELLQIDKELYAAVKKTGAKAGATLFATLLAAYEVLLYRLSGQSDFVSRYPLRRTGPARELHPRRPLRQHRAVASSSRPGGSLRRAPPHRQPRPRRCARPLASHLRQPGAPAEHPPGPQPHATRPDPVHDRQARSGVRLRRRDHRLAGDAEVVFELRSWR